MASKVPFRSSNSMVCFVLCQNFMFLKSLVDKYGVEGNDTVLNNQNGFCPHLRANPQRRKYKWARGQTWKWWQWGKHWSRQLKASFPGLPAMRKAEPAKSFRQSRPELWLARILSSPPYNTHKPHRKIVSLSSYLCLLAILLCMPSPRLIPFLPAVTIFRLLLSGALGSSCSLQGRHRGGGLGGGLLSGCVDSVRTESLLPGL